MKRDSDGPRQQLSRDCQLNLASFTNEQVANPVKYSIILNVEDETFFVQDNICVDRYCQLVYNKNFAALKKAFQGSKQILISKEIWLVLTDAYHVLFLLF